MARSRAQRSAGVSPGARNPLASISVPILGTSWPGSRSTRKAPRSPSRNTCALVGERDEAADAHAVRRHRRGQVLERTGARREAVEGFRMRRLDDRDGVAIGHEQVQHPRLRFGLDQPAQGRPSRAPARSPASCGSGCRQWPATVRRNGVPSNATSSAMRWPGVSVATRWTTPATSTRSASSRYWSVRAGRKGMASGRASVPRFVTRSAMTSGSGSPASVTPSICRRSPTWTSAGVVDPDEHAAGRILDVERAPDRIDERHGGGHRHGVVQRGPIRPDVRGSPRPSRAGPTRSATATTEPGRARSRPVRAQAGEQTEDQRTGRQPMWGSRHDDWVFNRQWGLVV